TFLDLLVAAQQHGRVRPDVTGTDVTMIIWSLVAIIDTTGTVAPGAWRRHLQLLLAGLRPDGAPLQPLTEPALGIDQVAAITGVRAETAG
ncbi:hypothetical protein WAC30_28720, partial [Klebsiella pneumoniae]|uniref:SbtR family transcriptional regulator n=1 Tax=Klebsiella pneumoniae TaxID=573 RepID=UPI003012C787